VLHPSRAKQSEEMFVKEFVVFSQRRTSDSGSYVDSFREFYYKAINCQRKKPLVDLIDIETISVEHFGFQFFLILQRAAYS